MHLNPLTVRVLGQLTFTSTNGIHIGAGGEGVYRSSLRVGEMLVIPATTWKGVFRAISERIIVSMRLVGIEDTLRRLYREDGQGVGFKIDEMSPTETEALRDHITKNYEAVRDALGHLAAGNSEVTMKLTVLRDGDGLSDFLLKESTGKSLLQRYLGTLYPITSLYGSEGVAGKMRFLDTLARALVYYKPGVGINRNTLTTSEGRLYFTEVMLPEDNLITLRLIFDNVMRGTTEARLLAATLRYVKSEGVQIGGLKSRGIGHLELNEDKSHFRILDLSEKIDLNTKIRRIASPRNWEIKIFDEFLKGLSNVGE
ncbi:MAG: RAMP superfamily CRISPR-associated protein [Nitrososphaerota archaeon]